MLAVGAGRYYNRNSCNDTEASTTVAAAEEGWKTQQIVVPVDRLFDIYGIGAYL